MYGRDPPKLLCYGDVPTANTDMKILLQERGTLLHGLRENLDKAQKHMQASANKHRRDVHFPPGQWVYLKLCPYHQSSFARCRNEKIAPRYFGPYEIEAKIGSVAYKLKLPKESVIHTVFHVSQLKIAASEPAKVQPIPLFLSPLLEWLVEPELVQDIRKAADGRY